MIIGITGLAGAGKSAVAQHLVAEHGFTRLSFAAPLKAMLRTLDPYLPATTSMYGDIGHVRLSRVFEYHDNDETALKLSIYGPEYRRLLQVLGTDCVRAVDPDFWVRAALAQVTTDRVVFDDCRFPNEAAAVDTLWCIDRPGVVRGSHDSEQYAGRMNEHWTIYNEGDLDQLHVTVDSLVGRL